MKQSAFFKIQKKYGGKFIASKGSVVLASAPSLGSLHKLMKKKSLLDDKRIVIEYLDPPGVICVYHFPLSV